MVLGVPWWQALSVVAAGVTVLWGGLALVGWLRRRSRAKGGEGEETTETPGEPVMLSGLSARPLLRVDDFRNREEELAQLGRLMSGGGVVWVTGPAQAGKSALVSRYVRDVGAGERALRYELREGVGLQAVLEGTNSALCERGERGFDAACRSVQLAAADRVGPLLRVLGRREWVIVLESYEKVHGESDLHELAKAAQRELTGSALVVTSRVMPEWGEQRREVEVSGVDREVGEDLLREAGAPEEALGAQ